MSYPQKIQLQMSAARLWIYVRMAVCAMASASAFGAESVDSTDAATPEPPTVFGTPLPAGVPSLQMSTDYSSPNLALGGYRPAPIGESSGMRIEPFTIRGGIHAGLGYDDNVTLSSTNKVGSWLLSVSPSIAAGLEGATQRYYVTYRGNYGRFFSSSVDDYADHDFVLSAANDWSARLRSLFAYEFMRGHDARGTTTANQTGPDTWDVNALRGTVSYGAAGAQGRLEGNAAFTDKKYRTPTPPGVARDFERFEVGGVFFYRLAPKTQALVELRRAEVRHHEDPLLDSSEMRYLVGATWDATAKTTGGVRVGYMTKDPDSAAAASFSAPTYEVLVTWVPLTYSRVEVNARRNFNEPAEPGSSFIVDDFVSTAWTHAWSGDVQSVVSYSYGAQRHEGIGRSDTYHSLGLKAVRAVHRRVKVGAEFRHDVRNSPLPTLEFKRNITLVTVEAVL